MSNPTPQITNHRLLEFIKTYWVWRRLWLSTTALFAMLGLVYVLWLKEDLWTASQGLIIRDEATGAVNRLGRFASQTEMKAAQETILEMARNTQVLREALLEVGPVRRMFDFGSFDLGNEVRPWPSQRELADLAEKSIAVHPPKGAEFGTTEVIYLDIHQTTPTRAVALNRAVCRALDSRMRQVRVARAEGIINEIESAHAIASEQLQTATAQLQAIEREAGADLSDLRGLSEAHGAVSTSRQMLDTIKAELRQIENEHVNLVTNLNLLKETQTDPERLLSAPASILTAHPGLKKLREGLADAQLQTSQLRGRFTVSHPLVVVAVTAEEEIRAQLQAELAVALAAATKDVENSQARIQTLKLQLSQREERFAGLARMRALHDNLNNEVRARSRDLQETERQLAEARAARDAAMSSSLLTRLDEPVLGDHPIGPGRATICVGLSLAGWFLGLSLVFLLTPLGSDAPPGQRWNDSLGRRISDRFPWLAEPASGRSKTGRRRSDTDQRAGETALATVVGVNSLPAEAGTSSAMVNPGPVSLPQRPRRTSDRASSDQLSREQLSSDRAASGQAATRPFAMPVVPIVEDSLWLPPADNPFMAPSGNAGVIPPITPNFRTPSW